jgi:hypothetical protein
LSGVVIGLSGVVIGLAALVSSREGNGVMGILISMLTDGSEYVAALQHESINKSQLR